MTTTTANGGTSDSGSAFTNFLNGSGFQTIAQTGLGAFQTYEAAQTAKKVTAGLTPQTLMIVVLGLGALGVVALIAIKH